MERLRPLLHIDPVAVLPPEITYEIFSYLTPSMLLEASRASKAWRESTLDGRLWKQNFNSEGWGLNIGEIRSFEQRYNFSRMNRPGSGKSQADQRRLKKRPRHEVDGAEEGSSSRQSRSTSTQHEGTQAARMNSGLFRSPALLNHDEEMHDALLDPVLPKYRRGSSNGTEHQSLFQPSMEDTDLEVDSSPHRIESQQSPDLGSEMDALDDSSRDPDMMIHTTSGQSRVNYHYVFKQKKKLEGNWNAGSYKIFQLPHRDYPEEAHTECVYTIQHIGRYLVSGSRDRTLRIWDLDTQRLVRKPLTGHTASVLCLQFDNRGNEDIIISGSSDTDVIIWQFSTGKMIQKISKAHRESVLNLKFDHRFLVTCSKDKTIKIWNRHELWPGTKDYPVRDVLYGGKCPAYIVDLGKSGGSIDRDNIFTAEQREPLKPFSLLMRIDSHGAAVNAIYIHQDQLVSASGDRYVKVFDIHTGLCTATCRGHTKGIACVQYDGKRIVSGSSDNTIRIYDPATQAEVACLQGHSRLVRTIQAAFGDYPGSSREELAMEASEVDQQYYEARRTGTLPTSSSRSRARNDGSKQPKDITAIGAKLPPGGGGSRWGRIVSGSYDETIIIWKKASDGRWVMGHRLRQEEALQAAGGPLPSQSDLLSRQTHFAAPQNGQANNPQVNHGSANQPEMNSQGVQGLLSAPHVIQHAMQVGSTSLQTELRGTANDFPQHMNNLYSNMSQAMTEQVNAHQQQLQQQMAAASAAASSSTITTTNVSSTVNQQSITTATAHLPIYQQQYITGMVASAHSATQQAAQQAAHQAAQHQQASQQLPAAGPPSSHHTPGPSVTAPPPNSRVFKLQFDARRIVCCSQDVRIVGWDFANGDEKIIECSRFFDTPR